MPKRGTGAADSQSIPIFSSVVNRSTKSFNLSSSGNFVSLKGYVAVENCEQHLIENGQQHKKTVKHLNMLIFYVLFPDDK